MLAAEGHGAAGGLGCFGEGNRDGGVSVPPQWKEQVASKTQGFASPYLRLPFGPPQTLFENSINK